MWLEPIKTQKMPNNIKLSFIIVNYRSERYLKKCVASLFDKIKDVKIRLKKEFLADTRPWVVTFSGGKDSTTVLQLVVEMLLDLSTEEKDFKKVYVVSSDTGVEMPIIEDYTTDKIGQIAKNQLIVNFSSGDTTI